MKGGKAGDDFRQSLEIKSILAVDNEPDILETVEEKLNICIIRKAIDYETAMHYLVGFTFDIVIFHIRGVNGFELLKDVTA